MSHKQSPRLSLRAIILIAALSKPTVAKRSIMAARALRLIDDNETALAIAALGLDGA